MSELRMYCIVSKEALDAMGGNRGKLVAQAGHAFLHAFWDAEYNFESNALQYEGSNRAVKIVLLAETTQDVIDIVEEHKSITGTTVVKDAGLTVFKEPTITCGGIGPITKEECSEKLKSLKPLL